MPVSMAYEDTGRVRQKERTRAALIAAARDLVAAGETPTVEQAAAAAGVSRPTAYRYFASRRSLLAAAHPEIGVHSLLPDDAPEDVEARLDLVLTEFARIVVSTEAQQRTMLRLSLDPDAARDDLPLRQGRAIGWIEEALEPLGDRLPAGARHQLAVAIRSAVGIESLVWLTDIAGLDRERAVQMMRWSAQALLRSALAGHPPEVSVPPDGPHPRG
jgi:AcrR family transcriptional regulator